MHSDIFNKCAVNFLGHRSFYYQAHLSELINLLLSLLLLLLLLLLLSLLLLLLLLRLLNVELFNVNVLFHLKQNGT